MDVQALIRLIVGAIAGWLAGIVVKGGGSGLIGDIIVGIIGGEAVRLVLGFRSNPATECLTRITLKN